MTRLPIILILAFCLFSCGQETTAPQSQAKYTYNLEGWESLGSQTLVMIEASNASSLDQQITFKVEVINTLGKVFSKDTTIDFEKSDHQKKFQLMVDTEGEIKDVKVSAI